jgi:hypothetical protein
LRRTVPAGPKPPKTVYVNFYQDDGTPCAIDTSRERCRQYGEPVFKYVLVEAPKRKSR